ncbi:YybH family protein [Rhizobium laguerreae]|uniref:YybH family protein n=1 Tax=Rhizobium laguerreae TaxID=1076926 RepID=UPI00143F78A3|nr:nuclear transport factor 2 family protein [Rhizobium laguerreae]MBN9982256.1 nuclear transport factor 2 family protein [Rhizobium laguerreae]MBY3248035.1 nuclear transport factor 2 family protein [Rhizobium laguerreae]MBY3316192.1 nuclear transport factor 2 family protein [Rhizobium laguerreae]MBY3329393.1 nuclear transport factor 2 family protein [Rhizobium laguerreae]MBY3360817.1 nuclear transport factor 2 family protein [Rhizobium laguerreae]
MSLFKSQTVRGDKPVHEAATLSLRAALAMAVAATGRVAHAAPASDAALLGIIHRTEQQAAAFMAGDMTRWANLIRLDDDFTLMQPFGGSASHGFDDSPEHLAELARFFRNGGGTLEVEKSYVSGDLIVLVMIERQHGEVGSLPDQNWSLRVTQVYRRHGSEWRLAHRHADPLVGKISLEQAAALARGE